MNMEDLLKESLKQVPALAVVVMLCTLFIKSSSTLIDRFLAQQSESRAEYLKAIEHLQGENIDCRLAIREAVVAGTAASEKQTNALNDVCEEVRQLRSSVNSALRHLPT